MGTRFRGVRAGWWAAQAGVRVLGVGLGSLCMGVCWCHAAAEHGKMHASTMHAPGPPTPTRRGGLVVHAAEGGLIHPVHEHGHLGVGPWQGAISGR